MKKIISNKVYDTSTARRIGGISYGNGDQLFGWGEDLFCKCTGEYFLHGHGGPGSKYSEMVGPSESAGYERIYPLSYDDARAWAEKNLAADVFTGEFGEIVEDGTNAKLNLYMSASTIERAKRKAAQDGTTLSAYVEALINAACGGPA